MSSQPTMKPNRGDIKKRILLKCIDNSPGIRYRELIRATGFPDGVMSWHLKILEKSKRIRVSRYNRRTTRYYPFKITAKEVPIIEFMKRATDRRIILFLLKHPHCKFGDIQQSIKRVASTVSYHLSRLKEARIISFSSQRYRLRNKLLVVNLIKKIKV